MVDVSKVNMRINRLIDALDPNTAEVAICHLRDAMSAIAAISEGKTPAYTMHDKLVNGRVIRAENATLKRFR